MTTTKNEKTRCPGCLLDHEGEPCALHRAAADLLAACERLDRYAHDTDLDDEDSPGFNVEDLRAVVEVARSAIRTARGGGR